MKRLGAVGNKRKDSHSDMSAFRHKDRDFRDDKNEIKMRISVEKCAWSGRSVVSEVWHKNIGVHSDDGASWNMNRGYRSVRVHQVLSDISMRVLMMSEWRRGLHNCIACTEAIEIYLTSSWAATGSQRLKDETFWLRLFGMSLGCFDVERGM